VRRLSGGKARILLISPKYHPLVWKIPPLALIHLASLTPKSIKVRIIDENLEKIVYSDYDLVGISVTTPIANRAYKIADKFRESGVKVILGGIHVSMLPEEARLHADSIMIGESEGLWGEVCRDLLNGGLKGAYSSSEPVDIWDLPPMNHDVLNRKNYFFQNSIQITRGCPYNCDFCCTRQFFGSKIRKRKIVHVLEEIKSMIRTASGLLKNFVSFNDDNIIADRDYSKELFRAITPLNIRWSAQCTINIADDDELLDLAYKSGCRVLFIGLESVNQDSLNSVNKQNKFVKYMEAIKKIRDKGILIHGLFILGLDYDRGDVFRKTLDFCNDSMLDFVTFNILRPFPGTPFFNRMRKQKKILTYNWDKYERVVTRPKNMTISELERGVEFLNNSFYSHFSIIRRGVREFLFRHNLKSFFTYFIESYVMRVCVKKINKLSFYKDN